MMDVYVSTLDSQVPGAPPRIFFIFMIGCSEILLTPLLAQNVCSLTCSSHWNVRNHQLIKAARALVMNGIFTYHMYTYIG